MSLVPSDIIPVTVCCVMDRICAIRVYQGKIVGQAPSLGPPSLGPRRRRSVCAAYMCPALARDTAQDSGGGPHFSKNWKSGLRSNALGGRRL